VPWFGESGQTFRQEYSVSKIRVIDGIRDLIQNINLSAWIKESGTLFDGDLLN